MSTYRKIHGRSIQAVTTDPTESVAEGQVWYNTSSDTFKSIVAGEAWSTGGSLATGRYSSGSLGTQTAGVQIAGSSPTNVSNVEHYNGTGWSEETNYPSAGQTISGAGTQTAGIAYGGSTPSQTANAFDYNGTAWTAANSLPYAANNIASCGLAKTSVIGAVGRDGSSGNSGTNKTVTFDGTNFANGPNINTTRMFNNSSGAGTGTAALIVGGFIDPSPNAMTNCEEYNGVAWTATGALNVATGFASAFGIQTNAVAQTNGSNYTATEGYNGSTWTTLPSMSVSSPGGLYGSAAGSTGDAGWVSSMSPAYNATEEFNRSANIITGAAWASGGDYPTSVGIPSASSTGTQTAQLAAGGYVGGAPGRTNVTGEYNGTSWSTGGAVPALVDSIGLGGTQTAAISAGEFRNDPTNTYDTSRDYDGSSWTTNNSLPAPAFDVSVFGTQTACIGSGGVDTAPYPGRFGLDRTLSWDGTNWTSLSAPSNQNTARFLNARAGVQTAAMISGGNDVSNYPGGAPKISTVENWDGSSWTAGTSMNTARSNTAGGGIQTLAYVAGGNTGSNTTQTELWDGSSWATSANLSTGGEGTGGTGTTPSAGIMFGRRPTAGAATEEFTGETTAVRAVKTIDFD